MNLLKKSALALAATSIILSPVAASAAAAPGSAYAISVTDDQNELEGASWLPILLGLAIIGGGIWLLVDDDNNADPVSPG